jgi:hypothetical protein
VKAPTVHDAVVRLALERNRAMTYLAGVRRTPGRLDAAAEDRISSAINMARMMEYAIGLIETGDRAEADRRRGLIGRKANALANGISEAEAAEDCRPADEATAGEAGGRRLEPPKETHE